MSDKPNTEQMAIQGLGEPLEVTIRGDRAEDIYSGHVVVVSMDGKIMAHAGDPDIWTFIRSTAKPIQAIPSVRAGVMEKFGFDTRALALMTSSHRGSPEHIAVLEQMLKLTGIKEADLVFDEAKPADPRIRDEWARKGGLPRKLYHVCAGKHIGLLALCKLRGWPMESYTDPEHPLQQELLQTIAAMADLPAAEVGRAVDGCGLPVFAMPLWRLALMYTRLAALSPDGADDETKSAADRITIAMNAWPDLVEGEGRLASIMLADGTVIAKSGAQGLFVFGMRQQGIAVALKLADGGEASQPGIICSVLEKLHVGADLSERINQHFSADLYNDAGQLIGHRESSLRLKFH